MNRQNLFYITESIWSYDDQGNRVYSQAPVQIGGHFSDLLSAQRTMTQYGQSIVRAYADTGRRVEYVSGPTLEANQKRRLLRILNEDSSTMFVKAFHIKSRNIRELEAANDATY